MALKKCKECGNQISTKAKSCPKCGAVLKRKVSGFFSFIVLGFVFISLVGVVTSTSDKTLHTTTSSSSKSTASTPKSGPTTPKAPVKPKLEVLDFDWGRGEFGNRMIQGTVRNNTSSQYSYVQVEINLYDNSGAQVGSTLANVNNLEPNGTWKFEAPVLESNAKKAKVKDVTGF